MLFDSGNEAFFPVIYVTSRGIKLYMPEGIHSHLLWKSV